MIDYKDKHRKYIEILELDPERDLTAEEIKSAYRKLIEFYSPESMAVDLLDDEFSSEDRRVILARVEEAYEVLIHEVGDIEETSIPIEEIADIPVNIAEQDTLIEYIPDTDYENQPLEITYTYIPDDEINNGVKVEYEKNGAEKREPVKLEYPIENIARVSVTGEVFRAIREGKGWHLHELSTVSKISEEVLEYIEAEQYEKLPDGGDLRYYITTLAKLYSLDPHHVVEEYMKHYRHWKRDQENNQ